MWPWIAGATLVAFALRIWGIGDLGDLDFDEQASFFIGSMPPLEMLRYLVSAPFEHPPLFYLLFHVWLLAAGGSETAMRVFPVIPGTLTVPLLGLVIGRIAGGRAGGVAAWSLALSPLHVYYSRDARMYSLLGLFTVIILAGITWRLGPGGHRASCHPGRSEGSVGWLYWLGAGLAVMESVATHYYAMFVALGILVGAAWARPLAPGLLPGSSIGSSRRGWLLGAVGSGLALLVAALVWVTAASGLRTSLTAVYPRAVDPAVLAPAVVGSFAAPLASPLTPVGWLLPAAVMTLAIVVGSLRVGGGNSGALQRIALLGFLIPTVAVPLLLLLGRPFAPRFVALAAPLLPVLAGLAATRLSWRWLGGGAALALPLLVVGLAPMYGGYTRGDYGRAMNALRAEVRGNDAIVLNGPWQDLLYRRYGVGLPPRSIIASTVPLIPAEAERNLAAIAAVHPRIWVVDAATDAADPNGVVATWLEHNAYPRPVIPFEKALLRPHLTDVGRPSVLQERPVGASALEVQVDSVGLDSWQLSPGAEARLRLMAHIECPASGPRCPPTEGSASGRDGGLRLSLQLLGADDQALWHWDGELAAVGQRLEYRAGLVIPAGTPAGRYPLQALVYEATSDGQGGRRLVRMGTPLDVGAVEVLKSP